MRGTGLSAVWELLQESPQRSEDMTAIWQRERRQELFRYAATQVKDHFAEDSWQAFWMTAVEGASVNEGLRQLEVRFENDWNQ